MSPTAKADRMEWFATPVAMWSLRAMFLATGVIGLGGIGLFAWPIATRDLSGGGALYLGLVMSVAIAILGFAFAFRYWGRTAEPVLVIENRVLSGWGAGSSPIPLREVIDAEVVRGGKGTKHLMIALVEREDRKDSQSFWTGSNPCQRVLWLPGIGDAEMLRIVEIIRANI